MIRIGLISVALGLVFAACGGASDSGLTTSTAKGDGADGGVNGADSGGSNASSGDTNGATNDGTNSATNNGDANNTGDTTGNTNGTVPDPEVVRERCDEWCDGIVSADCANDGNHDECVAGCRILTSSAACAEPFADLFDCAQGKDFECNDNGEAQPVGCGIEQGLAGGCLLVSTPDPDLRQPCEDYCDQVAAAECENDDPYDDCVFGCMVAGPVRPECSDDWDAFLDCNEGKELNCNDDGKAYTITCVSPWLDYVSCLFE